MTKQELEKRKGIRLSQKKASPAEALLTSMEDKTVEEKAEKVVKEVVPAEPIVEKPAVKEVPASKDLKVKHYSIRLPEDMAEDMNLAKAIYGDLAKYVRTLIQKDMEKNRDEYAAIKARADSLL